MAQEALQGCFGSSFLASTQSESLSMTEQSGGNRMLTFNLFDMLAPCS